VERFNSKGNMMAESKFTKGPWGVLHDPSVPRSKRIGAVGKQLAIVSSSWMPLAEIEANAELMADAPRLLEVLRTLHDFALPLRYRGLAETSVQAFADARALLEKHGG
jgi:hypothetical protein